jgi:hypothetical protein
VVVVMMMMVITIIMSGHVVIISKEPKSKYRRAPVSTDSVSAFSVIRDSPRPEKNNWKVKEINGS